MINDKDRIDEEVALDKKMSKQMEEEMIYAKPVDEFYKRPLTGEYVTYRN